MLADVSAPHGARPVYPGFCRRRQPFWGETRGRLPSWRLRLGGSPLCWSERFAREGRLDGPAEVGDVILRRADGLVAYHLATAVDELLLGITDVVRGEDLWWATGAQVAVMREMGAPPPRYGHVPLWRDRRGQRLSKRLAGEGLQAWREQGLDPAAAIGRLASSLDLVPQGSRLSARELLESLEPTGFERRLSRLSEA
jgi:glutamyl-tRNA synthetase